MVLSRRVLRRAELDVPAVTRQMVLARKTPQAQERASRILVDAFKTQGFNSKLGRAVAIGAIGLMASKNMAPEDALRKSLEFYGIKLYNIKS